MSAVGQSNPFSDASEYNSLDFIIARATEKMQTVTIVTVQAVNTGAQTVDVQVLVNLVTGSNTPVEHQVISGRPYYRMQGGGNAIICDPVAGDIGIMVFASRDTSGVIAAKGAANPSSNRKFSWSDGMYFGGILNGTPTQYMQFQASGGGINIVSPGTVAIQAPAFTASGTANIAGATTLQATLAVASTSTFTGMVTATAGLTAAGPITGTSAVFSGNVTAASFTGGGGGGGSVTSVGISTPGVGVVVGGGPVTSAGTLTVDLSTTAYAALALAVTALQPKTGLAGSYTSANLTINSLGQITAISNGSGGGGSLSVTDGTTTITGVTAITVVGGTVSGTSPNATITISGGGGTGPAGVTANLFFWFQADQLAGSAGSNIGQLPNSVPGFSAYTSYVGNGGATGAVLALADLNGLNTANFQATGQSRYAIINAAFAATLQQSTCFYVVKMASPSTAQVLLAGSNGSYQIGTDGTGKMAITSDLVAVLGTNASALPVGSYFQQNVTWNNATQAYAFRTSQAADGSGTGAGTISNFNSNYIGWNQPANVQDFNGELAEFIIYNRVLTSAEIMAVEAYLHTKWGV